MLSGERAHRAINSLSARRPPTHLVRQVHIDGVLREQGRVVGGLQQGPSPSRRLFKAHLLTAGQWPGYGDGQALACAQSGCLHTAPSYTTASGFGPPTRWNPSLHPHCPSTHLCRELALRQPAPRLQTCSDPLRRHEPGAVCHRQHQLQRTPLAANHQVRDLRAEQGSMWQHIGSGFALHPVPSSGRAQWHTSAPAAPCKRQQLALPTPQLLNAPGPPPGPQGTAAGPAAAGWRSGPGQPPLGQQR